MLAVTVAGILLSGRCDAHCGCSEDRTASRQRALFPADGVAELKRSAARGGGFGLFAKKALKPGDLVVRDTHPAVRHTFKDPLAYSKDKANLAGMKTFLTKGDRAYKKQGQEPRNAWRDQAEGLFSLYPANLGSGSELDAVLDGPVGRSYASGAMALKRKLAKPVQEALLRASCCDSAAEAVQLGLMVLRSNGLTVSNPTMTTALGSVTSAKASFINHECRPNVKIHTVDIEAVEVSNAQSCAISAATCSNTPCAAGCGNRADSSGGRDRDLVHK